MGPPEPPSASALSDSAASASAPPRRLHLFVLGEERRGDDGAAFAAVGLVPPAAVEAVVMRRVGQLSPEDLVDLGPEDACLIVDAVAGVPAGSIVRRSLGDLATGDADAPRSTHALPLPDILGLVATLRGELPRGTFLGIGGASFGTGRSLSRAVRTGLPAFVAAIERELAALKIP